VSHLILSPIQCRAARALLNWRLDDLAAYAGIHRQQLHRFEAGHTVQIDKLALRRIFESAQLWFTDGAVHFPVQWNYEV
jgi:hypothetical protein